MGNKGLRYLNNRYAPFISCLVGSILVLGFAPFRYGLIPIPCLSYLLYDWLYKKPYESFVTGFLFGLGFFGIGVSWIFISIHRFTATPWILSVFLTLLLICFLASFIGFQGYLFAYARLQNFLLFTTYFLFPGTLCAVEGLRSMLLGGFPWLLIGTTQVNSPLAFYGPCIGIYGLSWIVALQSSFLVHILLALQTRNFRKITMNSLFITLIFLGGHRLKTVSWVHPTGSPLKFSLVQANISQDIKWDLQKFRVSLSLYKKTIESHWNSHVIVLPEGAISIPLEKLRGFLYQLDRSAKEKQTQVIVSGFSKQQNKYYNSLIRLGSTPYTYYKRKLVPFGEYTPAWLTWSVKFLQLLDIPFSNLHSGPLLQEPFKLKDYWVGPLMCYEIAYSHLVQRYLPHSHLLLVISNDAWFGDSLALEQHLQIAQAQALISGRSIAFLSNTGPTAVINHQGKITHQIPAFKTQTLKSWVQPNTGATLWSKIGDIPVFVLSGILILVGLFIRIHQLNKSYTVI